MAFHVVNFTFLIFTFIQSVITNMADTGTCEAVAPLARNPLFDIINFIFLKTVDYVPLSDQIHPSVIVSPGKSATGCWRTLYANAAVHSVFTNYCNSWKSRILKALSAVDCLQKE